MSVWLCFRCFAIFILNPSFRFYSRCTRFRSSTHKERRCGGRLDPVRARKKNILGIQQPIDIFFRFAPLLPFRPTWLSLRKKAGGIRSKLILFPAQHVRLIIPLASLIHDTPRLTATPGCSWRYAKSWLFPVISFYDMLLSSPCSLYMSISRICFAAGLCSTSILEEFIR